MLGGVYSYVTLIRWASYEYEFLVPCMIQYPAWCINIYDNQSYTPVLFLKRVLKTPVRYVYNDRSPE